MIELKISMPMVFGMSIHIIAEFFGVAPEKISKIKDIRSVLDKIISKSGLHVVSSCFYQFKTHGFSVVYILSESHFSVHTWPEHGYMALDIFTCGEDAPALKAFELLKKEFKPKRIKKRIIRRDGFGESRKLGSA